MMSSTNTDVQNSDQMTKLFLADTPMIDVRAAIEFNLGAFPSATNLPILNDEERHQVGICYKTKGAQSAEQLGESLVSGEVRESRLTRWVSFIRQHPESVLYCFRGGKRSQIACDWLQASGIQITRVPGGYKAMRRFLLSQFDDLPDFTVVSGKTGVGKTILLEQLPHSLDLEGHAHHRGSAFGRHIEPQPTQIAFENAVAISLLKLSQSNLRTSLYLEDEGRLIGRVHLPPELQAAMKESPIVLLEDSLINRVQRIYEEYILIQWQTYRQKFVETAHQEFCDYLLNAIDAIRKRLGGVGHAEIRQLVEAALEDQIGGDFEPHKKWIQRLLEDYYDPMYNYQLEKKAERILFRGSMQEIIDRSQHQVSD